MTDSPKIQLRDVHKRFGSKVVLDGVDWDADQSPAGGSFARRSDGTFQTTVQDTRGVANAP